MFVSCCLSSIFLFLDNIPFPYFISIVFLGNSMYDNMHLRYIRNAHSQSTSFFNLHTNKESSKGLHACCSRSTSRKWQSQHIKARIQEKTFSIQGKLLSCSFHVTRSTSVVRDARVPEISFESALGYRYAGICHFCVV